MRKKIYSRIAGGSLAMLITFGLFSYLTFIPKQTFAESLIVDPNEHRSLSDIDTMQEMSQQICINSGEHETKQLEDTRINNDGKTRTYWVTKLKDGNCWMTQNLDYEPSTTPEIKEKALGNWPELNNDESVYYSPDADADVASAGRYYYYTIDGRAPEPCTSEIGFSECYTSGFSSETPDTTSSSGLSKEHFRIGNYYSFSAAQKVCPITTKGKAWQLPTSYTLENGSFYALLEPYKMASGLNVGTIESTNKVDGVIYTIYGKPLYFIYGGGISGSRLNKAGENGFYWSSTDRDTSDIYANTLTISSIASPSGSYAKRAGYFVRCLYSGGWLDSYPSDIPPAQGSALISVTVSPVISLDVTKSANTDFDVDFTDVYTDTIITNVSSNYQYTVSISTEQTKLLPSTTDQEGNTIPDTSSTNYIPMIGTSVDGNSKNDVEKSVSGWGIKKKLSAIDPEELGSTKDNTTYSPVGTTNPEVFYKSKGPEALTTDNPDTDPLTFTVGVGISPNLPSGKYSTTITITASVI